MDDTQEWLERAEAAMLARRYAEAAALYAAAAERAPRDPEVRVRLAEACRRNGDRARAVMAYRAASGLYAGQDRWGTAATALRLALQLEPADVALQAALTRAEAQRQQARTAVLAASGRGPPARRR